MTPLRPSLALFAVSLLAGCASSDTAPEQAPAPTLASWRDGEARQQIVAFVERVTTPGPDFVPEAERIAVFDNDGTLWSEQPAYFQLDFAVAQVQALADQHPEWTEQEPFASVLRGDLKGALAGGEHALFELVIATHGGMTTEAFTAAVETWIAEARHPTTGKPYTAMIYQPMRELLDYLRAHGFKTFIVSGGGIDFMRPWTASVYGIPPEQVVGSSVELTFELRGEEAVVVRQPKLHFIDDKEGKPVGIQRHIGRRPLAAFGNSDGDLAMLRWTASGEGPRLCAYVHHDDAEREWAYDRDSHIGRLNEGLDVAQAKGWTVISMRNDWTRIHPETASE